MDTSAQAELFPDESHPRDVIVVSDRCVLRLEGEHRIVLAAGVVLAHFVASDRMAAANVMVQLVEQGWARQCEVARAFQCSARTVRRCEQRFDESGLSALGRTSGYPRGKPRTRARDRAVVRLKTQGLSNRVIAQRLGVDEKSVRKRLRRLGWAAPAAEQQPLAAPSGSTTSADPNLSASAGTPAATAAFAADSLPIPPPTERTGADPNLSASERVVSEPESLSFDRDPADRRLDRLLAYLGVLDDAAPRFRDGCAVPGGGVLLAVPSLVISGVFDAAREVYGSIGPAFYGLRTTILTLLLMALLRIQRTEALKERSPTDLGRVLGLDRAPEVKTVRRKLTRLAQARGSAEMGRQLAQRRVAHRGQTLGFLYVDGHVRAYHGKRRIPKTHVARIRLSMPATTDYWVNDTQGDPLFVVTAEANAGLVKVLPTLLAEVRALVGERRVTVVFDRGGYSPKLFAQLLALGFDLLTYRKGKYRRVPRRAFREHTAVFDGRAVTYRLADQDVRLLRRTLRLRQ